MRLNDAVHDVTGEIFRDGWSRIRGSMQGLQASRQRQLVRAAAGHRAAVFKAIRGGGTHTKSQLANQLDYLTTKSTHINVITICCIYINTTITTFTIF